jgi:hypothetical protein
LQHFPSFFLLSSCYARQIAKEKIHRGGIEPPTYWV